MRIRVLGKYGRFAPPGAAANGYLVETEAGKFCLDFGPNCLSKLLKLSENDLPRAIVLSHLHFDHISDIFTYGYYLDYRGLKAPEIYLPASPSEEFRLLTARFPMFPIHRITDGATAEICGIKVRFLASSHSVETYMTVLGDNRKVLYTSDCNDVRLLRAAADGVAAVIGDACVTKKEYFSGSPHFAVRDLAENIDADTDLYLGHLTWRKEEDALAEALCVHAKSYIVQDFEVLDNAHR